MNIEIVIPVFRPDGRLKMSIERLLRQSVMPDRILLEVLYENPIDREIPEVYMDKRIEIFSVKAEQRKNKIIWFFYLLSAKINNLS